MAVSFKRHSRKREQKDLGIRCLYHMNYVAYIFRPPSLDPTTVKDVSPNIIRDCALCCAFFSILCIVIPRVIAAVFPVFYKNLSDTKKNEIPTYVSCLAHHCVVVVIGFRHIFEDYHRSPEVWSNFNHAAHEWAVVPYCVGYLFADTIFIAVGEALRGKPDYLLHHVLSFGLIYYLMTCPSSIARFIPHIIICEGSQLFFIAAWLFRLVGLKDHWAVPILEICFAISFTLLRVVNLPMAVWQILTYSETMANLTIARALLWPIVGLQFFWLYKIIQGVMKRAGPAKANKIDKSENEAKNRVKSS